MKTENVQVGLTIRFMDGSKMRFAGPKQAKDTWDAMRKIQNILDRPYLCFETDDGVVVVPTANIKYFQFAPKPQGIPEFFIKGTRIVEG